MNKCQSPVAQQSTRFLHCVTGSARKDNSHVWHCLEFVSNSYLKVLLAALAQHYFSLFFDWNLHNESANLQRDKYPQSCIPLRSHNSVIVCWQSKCPSSTVSHAQPDWVRAKLTRPDACKPTAQIMCTSSCILPIDFTKIRVLFLQRRQTIGNEAMHIEKG